MSRFHHEQWTHAKFSGVSYRNNMLQRRSKSPKLPERSSDQAKADTILNKTTLNKNKKEMLESALDKMSSEQLSQY